MKKLIITICAVMAVSCSPKMSAILPEGKIIEKDGYRVLVVFQDKYAKPGTLSAAWVENTRTDTLTHEHYYELVLKRRQ